MLHVREIQTVGLCDDLTCVQPMHNIIFKRHWYGWYGKCCTSFNKYRVNILENVSPILTDPHIHPVTATHSCIQIHSWSSATAELDMSEVLSIAVKIQHQMSLSTHAIIKPKKVGVLRTPPTFWLALFTAPVWRSWFQPLMFLSILCPYRHSKCACAHVTTMACRKM